MQQRKCTDFRQTSCGGHCSPLDVKEGRREGTTYQSASALRIFMICIGPFACTPYILLRLSSALCNSPLHKSALSFPVLRECLLKDAAETFLGHKIGRTCSGILCEVLNILNYADKINRNDRRRLSKLAMSDR